MKKLTTLLITIDVDFDLIHFLMKCQYYKIEVKKMTNGL
jgi:hypothetical protein